MFVKPILFNVLLKIATIDRFMSLSKFHTLFFTGLFAVSFSAKAVDIHQATTLLPNGTQVSFIAKNLATQQIVADYRSQQLMLPASTQKVFTALAAKLVLPADFRFETALLTNGSVQNGVLKGDLIAKFSGDPDLTREQLFGLFNQLKQQGIQKIQGNLVLDTSVFTSHDKASGWVWNDLTVCFSAPPAAINIDNNCFYANLNANQKVGELAKVDVPNAYPVQVFSQAYVADKKEAGYCQLDVVVNDNNRYVVKGCLAQQSKPFGLSFAVQDPTAYGAAVIQANLKRLGIGLTGQVKQSSQAQRGKVLATHFSAPLDQLLKKMMKKSDNQIADALFRTLAYQQYQRSATFPLASTALRNVLKSKANVNFEHSIIVDGSGLSRHNYVSAETLLQALEYIAQDEQTLQLFQTFPIAGVDGTISGRSSVSQAPLANNLIAKTGSLKGIYNLAGFMTNARGERIAFVQFINGYFTGELDGKTKRGALSQFENTIYQSLYNE